MSNQNRPNILWVCTDQQRWDTLGCYGNDFVDTPVADQLAQDGVLFENAYCQAPICTPSRASFLTGRYPRTTRCRQNGQDIPSTERLVTRLLKDEGYVCGLSGKLHLSTCNPEIVKGTERRIDDGYDSFHWSHHPPADWATNEYIQWLTEQGVEYDTLSYKGSKYVEAGMSAEHHQTTWCAEKAITFMKENARLGNSWCFTVNIFDPHHPFDPPVEYLERYLDKLQDIPLPNYTEGELDSKTLYQQNDHHNAYNVAGWFDFDEMSADDHRLVTAAYWAMCDLIDEQLGRMIDALKETDQLDNTIIIFMSDHGEMLGDHGIYLKGPYFYEPAVHIPLIISMPGTIQAGVRSNALVELVDIAPTLLEAVGIDIYAGMQGKSLWNLLTGQSPPDEHRDSVYCEYYNAMPWHKDPTAQATMVRNHRYKLVSTHSTGQGELYDLEIDPKETTNQWSNPDYAMTKIEMLELLCHRMAWTVDPLPLRQADW